MAAARVLLAAERLRTQLVADRLERRYNPNWPSQPRVPRGDPDGGQWTLVGLVFRVCIPFAISLTTDQFGNTRYRVTYECRGGETFVLEGTSHSYPGVVRDPFQPFE